MAFNRVSTLEYYIDMVDFTKAHFDHEVMKYKPFWRKYIRNRYHIEYSRYMEVLGMPNLREELEREKARVGKAEDPNQLKLF